MRKHEKKMAEEFLALLENAHQELKKMIERESAGQTLELLSQCQQGAIQLGQLLEKTEGANCPTVALLEDYCELIYQIYEGIGQGAAVDSVKSYKRLKKQLIQIENSIKKDVRVKLEVVFLPYKASMWDSLESVWKAAAEDPNCDAYVVPIPYYDRNPDGSFGAAHYEGGQYPRDVPTVWYEDYNFAIRQPDAIFIHNPYDDQNYVTSIDPRFYSSQLRKYTKCLVYIPYFVSVVSVGEATCLTLGGANADCVILQSEQLRQKYIRAYHKLISANGMQTTPERLEKKFLALGSPKFDKAISAQPEEFDLPEQWRALIERSDGSRKRVILYNTTISAILQHNEAYLVKLRSALDAFRDEKEAVLWWRPHPLIQSTLQAMRPWLLEEYLRIVQDYQQGSWGIYDVSADVNRAIAYADCYYGDNGSALQASFLATGKPVMLQRIKPADSLSIVPLLLGADEKRLFFSLVDSSAILSLDFDTYKISVVRGGYSTVWKPYSLGVKMGEALYFTPVAAASILKLNLENQNCSTIPYELDEERLRQVNPKYQKGWNFSWAYACGDEIFFVGGYYPAIMCLDIHSNRLSYATDFPGTFQNASGTVCSCSCQMGPQIVLAGTTPVIAKFDMESKCFSTEEIPHEKAAGGFATVSYGDGYLWFMTKTDGTILRFDPSTKAITAYDQFPAGVLRCENMSLLSFYVQGYFWMFSDNTNAVLRLCAATGEISAVRMFSSSEQGESVHLGLPVLVGGKIYASCRAFSGISVYDVETGAYSDLPIQLSEDVVNSIKYSGLDFVPASIHETVLMENGYDTINTLIRIPARKNQKLISDWIASPDGTAGKKIYRHIKGLLQSD